jgi:hypothetical protein
MLLGGATDGAQAWLWNGTTWSVAPGTPPHPGLDPNIGSLNGSLVVSGGYDEVGGTWIWNGTQWSNPVNDAISPSPYRESSALATLNGKVLLFGGCESCGGSFGLLGDTWEWDGQSWTELHPAGSPPARFGAVAGTVAGKIVLFGGESSCRPWWQPRTRRVALAATDSSPPTNPTTLLSEGSAISASRGWAERLGPQGQERVCLGVAAGWR